MMLPGETGSKLRTLIIPFKHIGRNVRLIRGTWIEYPENLTIGDNTSINRNCLINAAGGVDIGKNVLIGPSVTIYSLNHNYSDRQLLIIDQDYSKARIIIENDVWLGLKSVILPGVTIGEGAIVGAGSVVTHDVPPGAIVTGVPARVVRIIEHDVAPDRDRAQVLVDENENSLTENLFEKLLQRRIQ